MCDCIRAHFQVSDLVITDCGSAVTVIWVSLGLSYPLNHVTSNLGARIPKLLWPRTRRGQALLPVSRSENALEIRKVWRRVKDMEIKGCFLVLRKLLSVRFCVVVWVLFSVFSIFCITSLVSATPRNHQIKWMTKKTLRISSTYVWFLWGGGGGVGHFW